MKNFYLIPYKIKQSQVINESSGVRFECPANTVMTGRMHSGDENGNTIYEYASLIPDYYFIGASGTPTEYNYKKESSSNFICQDNEVLIARQHNGDENGNSTYWCVKLGFNGKSVISKNHNWSSEIKESDSDFTAPENCVITGRKHSGDENGKTSYRYSELYVDDNKLIVTNIGISDDIKESSGAKFSCPNYSVIVGRKHKGDENGKTSYKYGFVFFPFPDVDEKGDLYIRTFDDIWSPDLTESNSNFSAPQGCFITGRIHTGDENGKTSYKYSKIKFGGWIANSEQKQYSIQIKESAGIWYRAPFKNTIVGRIHQGDENANTIYNFSPISVSVDENGYRTPTQNEMESLRNSFPHLTKCWITGEQTYVYNCIAWSMGFKDRWINPGETLDKFKKQYQLLGYADIPAQSDVAMVDGWTDNSIPQHGSKVYTGKIPDALPGLWESKLGASYRIAHYRDELSGSVYGKITISFKAPFISKEAFVKKDQWITQKEIDTLNVEISRISPVLKEQFENAFKEWKDSWFQGSMMFSSDTRDRAKGKLFEKLLALSDKIIPLVIEKLIDPKNFIALTLYDSLQQHPEYVVKYHDADSNLLEGEQARAQRTIRLWISKVIDKQSIDKK
jgi:predicted RNA-binding Zn-ribbon protein involved in translation (DUF1610 family)